MEEETSKKTSDNVSVDVWTKLVFMVFGLGPSWMAVSATFQQLPYFEKTQPEKACLAAFISLAVSSGVLFVGFNYLFMTLCNSNQPLAHRYAVPLVLVLDIFAMFYIATTWHYTIANMSIPLFLGALLGGGVGGLTQVMVMPFISLYKSDCLSAFRIGMDGGNLLCAVVAAIQRPGSKSSLFDPTVYFCVFGVIILTSVVAYRYILATGLGLVTEGEHSDREKENKDKVIGVLGIDEGGDAAEDGNSGQRTKSMTREVSIDSIELPPRIADSPPRAEKRDGGHDETKVPVEKDYIPNPLQLREDKAQDEDIEQARKGAGTVTVQRGEKNEMEPVRRTAGIRGACVAMVLPIASRVDSCIESIETSIMDTIFGWICQCFPKGMATRGWFRITLPYLLTIFYIDMNNFGLFPAIFPIALVNATGSLEEQENLLQLAFQVGAPLLYIADFLTFYVDVPLRYPVLMYFMLTSSIYVFGSLKSTVETFSEASRESLAMYLLSAFIIAQGLSGYILIMAWRKASIEPPAENREESSRWCGYADQISSFVGSVAAMPIVLTSGTKCAF